MKAIQSTIKITLEDWEIQLCRFSTQENLKPAWIQLEAESDCSFFLSWDWISTWLKQHTSPENLLILHISHNKNTIGLGLFTEKMLKRCKLFKYKSLLLHETGCTLDDITIEFNSLLVHRRYQQLIQNPLEMLFSEILKEWDTISLAGLTNKFLIKPALKHSIIHSNSKPHYWVDLERIRSSSQSYLSFLNKNTRSQIRQSYNNYNKLGPIEITLAQSKKEALDYFDNLLHLHTEYWKSKQKLSSFLQAQVLEFNKTLINDHFEKNHILLARIRAGNIDIGYLYNFSYNGHIYAYQSGIQYNTDNKFRPGLLSHKLLIDELLRSKAHSYDFMAGEYRYKKSLSSHQGELQWSFIMKNTLINKLLNRINCYLS